MQDTQYLKLFCMTDNWSMMKLTWQKKMKNLLSFQLFYHIHQHDRNKILVKICFLPLGQVLRFIEKKLWNNYYISLSSHHPKLLLHFVIFKSYGTYFCQKSNKNYCLHDITITVWTSHIQHQMFRTLKISNVH